MTCWSCFPKNGTKVLSLERKSRMYVSPPPRAKAVQKGTVGVYGSRSDSHLLTGWSTWVKTVDMMLALAWMPDFKSCTSRWTYVRQGVWQCARVTMCMYISLDELSVSVRVNTRWNDRWQVFLLVPNKQGLSEHVLFNTRASALQLTRQNLRSTLYA